MCINTKRLQESCFKETELCEFERRLILWNGPVVMMMKNGEIYVFSSYLFILEPAYGSLKQGLRVPSIINTWNCWNEACLSWFCTRHQYLFLFCVVFEPDADFLIDN